MKKLLSMILALVMVLALLPTGVITVGAASSGTTGDCTWSLYGTVLTISGNGAMGGYSYSNESPWGTSITMVVIEVGVTTIGHSAFYNCDSLTSVTIPDSVTTIGGGAFSYCTSLTSVTIPDSVTSIGAYAFSDCTRLASVIIGNGVTSIGKDAFCGSYSRNSVYITDLAAWCKIDFNGTSEGGGNPLNGYLYLNGSLVTDLIIPDGVTAIGDAAFASCHSLTSVTIPDSVTTIGYDAFAGCDSLTSVTIPDSVTTIESGAFEWCDSITDVWYTGGDYSAISIGSRNYGLKDARWHYNTCKKGHTYTADCDTTCNMCEWTRNVLVEHSYNADCDIACNMCKEVRSVSLEHAYDNACDASCNRCKATRTIKHDYKAATCTTPKTCKNCGVASGSALGHNYKAATCTAPKTCKVCKVTTGKANGHSYKAATCTVPKTCKVCKATSGKALGHSYVTTTKKATLTKNGSIVKACSHCDKVASKTTIRYAKTVKLSKTTYTYNGKAQKPSVTVKDSKGKTVSSKYYAVTYAKGCKNVGTYKVTVKFKGNYSGSKTLTFKINPPKTTVKKLTAAKKSLKVAITKKSSQVTGYQVQYSTSKKFTKATTKTVKSYKTTSYTIKKLSAKKTYYVRVRTYKTVNGKKYYSGWSTAKSKKTK